MTGKSVLLGCADAQGIRHPLGLEDSLDLRHQPDAVGLKLAEADCFPGVILRPLEAPDVVWAVELGSNALDPLTGVPGAFELLCDAVGSGPDL